MTQDGAHENPDKQLANRTAEPAIYDLQTSFSPNGDQPAAIEELLDGVKNDERDQVLLGVILSATDSLTWLSEITNKTVLELAELAGAIAPASHNCFFHPYLSGERTPHNDAEAKGGFIGLARTHGVAEMAYAVLEGVAFALGDCVDVLRQAGSQPHHLIATGGGAKNTHWLQMIADVTQCEIALPEEGDYGAALGAARLGAIAAGNDAEAVLTKPDIKTVFAPDQARHDFYHARRSMWQKLYRVTKAVQA